MHDTDIEYLFALILTLYNGIFPHLTPTVMSMRKEIKFIEGELKETLAVEGFVFIRIAAFGKLVE